MNWSLNDFQTDILIEIANMGSNRAAGKLSELTGQTVYLKIPWVHMLSGVELEHFLLEEVGPEAPCISQDFDGPISGKSLLVYPGDSAAQLAAALLGEQKDIASLSALERSALIEVGNILINAFMGLIAEMLELPIDFSVPQMFMPTKEIVSNLLYNRAGASELRDGQGEKVALFLNNDMSIEGTNLSGRIAVLLDVEAAKTMVERTEEVWLSV